LCELLACQPTTMAGLLALLDYVGQPEWLDGDEEGNTILSSGHEYSGKSGDNNQIMPRCLVHRKENLFRKGYSLGKAREKAGLYNPAFSRAC
jgi:hypothetical protein